LCEHPNPNIVHRNMYVADGVKGGAHAANISSNLGLGLALSNPVFVDEETAVRFKKCHYCKLVVYVCMYVCIYTCYMYVYLYRTQ
jgi:hypothetical protein